MSKTTISIIIVLLLVILGTTYVAFAPDSWRFWQSPPKVDVGTDDTKKDVVDPSFPEQRINAKHQFKFGKHVVAGEVNLPTACYTLSTFVRIAETYPEHVTLNFVAETSGDVCAQVVTTERFKIDFTASDKAVISAMWNGKPIELNLINAGPNEDLTNFELFIKG